MKTERRRNSNRDVPLVDRVVITAAVTALFGPNAMIRRITPASGRRDAWQREGRISLQNSHRMAPALVRSSPDHARRTA